MRGFLADYGPEIFRLFVEHFELTFLAVGASTVAAIPLGVLLTRRERAASIVLGAASVVQTIPSLALFGLVIPVLIAFGLPVIGWTPALIALFLYAILPILRNTYTGIRSVDTDIKEAATGLGMSSSQLLFKVELPLAVPVIMAGLRTSTVISVGITTLAALIGAGGLGELIFRGIRTINYQLMLAGAVPAAIMALGLDFVLALVERKLTPAEISTQHKV